jgi:UDP:flavonoid glycosyltransferase YjiC (YdhE family)
LYKLGVAPVPIPATELSAERLAAAFTAVTTEPSYRARAAQLAALIATEDGDSAVADAVEALVG